MCVHIYTYLSRWAHIYIIIFYIYGISQALDRDLPCVFWPPCSPGRSREAPAVRDRQKLFQERPRWHPDSPRGLQDAPRGPHERYQTPEDGVKEGQEAPKTPQAPH